MDNKLLGYGAIAVLLVILAIFGSQYLAIATTPTPTAIAGQSSTVWLWAYPDELSLNSQCYDMAQNGNHVWNASKSVVVISNFSVYNLETNAKIFSDATSTEVQCGYGGRTRVQTFDVATNLAGKQIKLDNMLLDNDENLLSYSHITLTVGGLPSPTPTVTPPPQCPANSMWINSACYCNDGFTASHDSQGRLSCDQNGGIDPKLLAEIAVGVLAVLVAVVYFVKKQ